MIKINRLSKKFKLYKKPSDRLKEIFLRRCYHHEYEALKSVSLTVNAGDTLGILGKNGAGKSTLLKIISGVLMPDAGEIEISGKITGLLELGTGFDPELSGIQNILGNGLLIGMSKDDIEQRRQMIIDFSELGEYIEEPVRTYSSGMMMRLAFSIAMHAYPDCFLIDEALSVGDAHFQQKCMQHIRQYQKQGGAIIFVSHDLNAVKMICDHAIVLDDGQVVLEGSAEQAVNHYNRLMAKLDDQEMPLSVELHKKHHFGNQKATILSAEFTGQQSKSNMVSSGEIAELLITVKSQEDIDDLTIGIMIRDRFGQDIFGTNSHHLGQDFRLKKDTSIACCFTIPIELTAGKYTITIALHSQDNHTDECYHWIDNMIKFEVAGIIGRQFAGVCRLDAELTFKPQ